MQFTPNIWEKYAASLRNLISKRLSKGENLQKNMRLLKIILVFSALCRSKIIEKVNLYKNIEELLNAAALKFYEEEKILNFQLSGSNTYETDYNLLKLLILELISTPTQNIVNIKILFLNGRIILTVQNVEATKNLKYLVRKTKGILIKIRGESNLAVKISTPCVLTFENLAEDNEDLSDPFSSVNIMLFR